MGIWPDIRYAVRAMRRSPAVAVIAILALALGIGANTAIFSIVNTVLLNSATMRDLRNPERLVMIWESNPRLGAIVSDRMPTALENFREWKRQSASFEDMATLQILNCNLTGGNASRERAARAGGGHADIAELFFRCSEFGRRLGRVFTTEDAKNRSESVAILSADLYRRRFGNGTALDEKDNSREWR